MKQSHMRSNIFNPSATAPTTLQGGKKPSNMSQRGQAGLIGGIDVRGGTGEERWKTTTQIQNRGEKSDLDSGITYYLTASLLHCFTVSLTY